MQKLLLKTILFFANSDFEGWSVMYLIIVIVFVASCNIAHYEYARHEHKRAGSEKCTTIYETDRGGR
jgi:hypothetical protein